VSSPGLRIESFGNIRGAPLLERELDALNRASRRPTPFNGTGYLQAFLDHDEFAAPGREARLLAAVEGDRLVGFLPLRRREARALGRTEAMVEFLVTYDNDRPAMAVRPEDERRCADAFRTHLLETARDWSVLELVNLEEGSPLLPAPGSALRGVYARTLEGKPTAIVPTPGPDVAAWFKTIKKSWRHTVSRLGRRFLAAGRAELVTSADPRARLPLLDLYLDLERRSWKREHGLGRHPARLALHRALCAPEQDLRLSFQLLLLDGVVVAGMICGDFAGVHYGMEICYDAGFAALGPGNMMSLLSIREAIRNGAPAQNLFADFGYYKSNWGATLVPTRTLQLFRTGSAHWLKARAGDLRRRLARAPADPEKGRFNQVKREVDGGEKPAPAAPGLPPREEERALAARVLAELARSGAAVERLGGAELEAAMPFPPAKDRSGT
jgi:CelD/BcsL family acetyltransferase involved in cellulose biosynthesis